MCHVCQWPEVHGTVSLRGTWRDKDGLRCLNHLLALTKHYFINDCLFLDHTDPATELGIMGIASCLASGADWCCWILSCALLSQFLLISHALSPVILPLSANFSRQNFTIGEASQWDDLLSGIWTWFVDGYWWMGESLFGACHPYHWTHPDRRGPRDVNNHSGCVGQTSIGYWLLTATENVYDSYKKNSSKLYCPLQDNFCLVYNCSASQLSDSSTHMCNNIEEDMKKILWYISLWEKVILVPWWTCLWAVQSDPHCTENYLLTYQ